MTLLLGIINKMYQTRIDTKSGQPKRSSRCIFKDFMMTIKDINMSSGNWLVLTRTTTHA